MHLNDWESAALRGEHGEPIRWAIDFQLSVGRFFGARRMVPVRSAHVMCDAEALGEAGVGLLESIVASGGRVSIPTTTDPRSVDLALWREIGQERWLVDLERRVMQSLAQMGALLCNTCINYQTVDAPRFGESLAWGDTGAAIYANSVVGARTNFEGGPAGLAAALAGRVAEYGFHLDNVRHGSVLIRIKAPLHDVSAWGAVGSLVGRRFPGYWTVPVFEGPSLQPSPDDLKHLGAALASYGSHAMFHLVGVTPEARTVEEAFGGQRPTEALEITAADLRSVYAEFIPEKRHPDLVVLGTPQLSIMELHSIAACLDGQVTSVPTFLTTSSAVALLAADSGDLTRIEASGAKVLRGVCFYTMAARHLARRRGFHTLVTNSAKLANIIAGYGYNPVLRSTGECLGAAIAGEISP